MVWAWFQMLIHAFTSFDASKSAFCQDELLILSELILTVKDIDTHIKEKGNLAGYSCGSEKPGAENDEMGSIISLFRICWLFLFLCCFFVDPPDHLAASNQQF